MGLVELFYGDGVAGKVRGIVKLIKAGGEAPTDYAVSVRGQGGDLTASPEDRPEVPIERKAPARKSAAKKARAKSKSDLLKALRDMR